MGDELWRWQAWQLADAIRAGKISSREAVASCLSRLSAVNPAINAVVDQFADDALADADRADKAVKDGAPLGPLHGVPVTYKINMDYAGRATTNGVVAFKDKIAKSDNPAIANWRRAGAIGVGRTNVPPFSARFFTASELHGRTLNPWDRSRTPGGSSGGAAAAVAAGIGPIAHGTDRAGSIRYPCYTCGIFGLRPTIGRIPSYNATAPDESSITTQLTHTQGPLARTVRDLRLGYHAMAERSDLDPWWTPAESGARPEPRVCRVALFASAPGIEVDLAVTEALRTAAKSLEDAGYQVEEAAPPHFEEIARLFFTLVRSEERDSTTNAIDRLGDAELRRARASTMAYASELDYDGYIKALARRTSILREWQSSFLQRYPLLLMPISWLRPMPDNYDQGGDAAVNRMLVSFHPMLAISMLGVPGLAVPTGLADGVPVGVQLVAGRLREELCLSAAEVIEARCPIRTPIDPRL